MHPPAQHSSVPRSASFQIPQSQGELLLPIKILVLIGIASVGCFLGLGADSPRFQPVETPLPNVRQGPVAWCDFDNDGDLDLLLCGDSYSFEPNAPPVLRLYRNSGGQFVDSGIKLPRSRLGSVDWGDFDNDGFLDLVIVGDGDTGVRILRNLGGTNFVETARLPGVYFGQAEFGDYNQDGLLDLVVNGPSLDGRPGARVYLNGGNGSFAETVAIPQGYGEVHWADYNRDGTLDLLVTGGGTNNATGGGQLYRNLDGKFSRDTPLSVAPDVKGQWFDADNDGWPDALLTVHTEITSYVMRNDHGAGFHQVARLPVLGATAIGDFDNDGWSDVLIVGYRYAVELQTFVFDVTRLFQHDHGIEWLERTDVFSNLSAGAAAWGDYDNDGRLDLVLVGQHGTGAINYLTRLYHNVGARTNHLPEAPLHLGATVSGADHILTWAESTDPEQSSGLTYNVRVGSRPGAGDVVGPMSSPGGFRRIVKAGNAGGRTNFYIRSLPPGKTYFWSVQAIDNAYAGSPFATEDNFYVNYPPLISAATNITMLENQSFDLFVTLRDADSTPEQLQLEVQSANPQLLTVAEPKRSGDGRDWKITLIPGTNSFGTTKLTLKAKDDTGIETSASVAVRVDARPRAYANYYTTSEDVPFTFFLQGLDLDFDPLKFVITRQPIHGSLIEAGQAWRYVPETNFFGTDMISFVTNDGIINSLTAVISILVLPVADVAVPKVQTLVRADGRFEIRFSGEPKQIYLLEKSNDLITWGEVLLLQSDSGKIVVNDPLDREHLFFRVRPVP